MISNRISNSCWLFICNTLVFIFKIKNYLACWLQLSMIQLKIPKAELCILKKVIFRILDFTFWQGLKNIDYTKKYIFTFKVYKKLVFPRVMFLRFPCGWKVPVDRKKVAKCCNMLLLYLFVTILWCCYNVANKCYIFETIWNNMAVTLLQRYGACWVTTDLTLIIKVFV